MTFNTNPRLSKDVFFYWNNKEMCKGFITKIYHTTEPIKCIMVRTDENHIDKRYIVNLSELANSPENAILHSEKININ
jgi:hypothetical protein